jgi:hypothetical protein
MHKVRELVETIILSAYVKGTDPVSLALIASPEHGKTSVVLEKDCKSVVVLSDVTGRGIQQLCMMRPEVTHFVLNDLTAISGKKAHVMQGTIAMLSAMTEEGIRATAYPGSVQTFEHGKRGIIVCMTPIQSTDQRNWWNRTGFASRLLPFCFNHSRPLKIQIYVAIRKGQNDGHWVKKEKPAEFKVPVALKVGISDAHAKYLNELVLSRATKLGEEGYRRALQYRTVARAHAIYRSWRNRMVTQKDIQFVEWMDGYVSYHEPKSL